MSRRLNRKRRPDPAGLCHLWRGAEEERFDRGSTWVNASSPLWRRGLHSGPGVNQSFVPASLRVNRFRCSICLQRLHVHAPTRPTVWPWSTGCLASRTIGDWNTSNVNPWQEKLPPDGGYVSFDDTIINNSSRERVVDWTIWEKVENCRQMAPRYVQQQCYWFVDRKRWKLRSWLDYSMNNSWKNW